MPTQLGELDLKEAAREAAGNWREFECFSWHRARDLVRPDDWCIVYGRHRDSGLLDQSNAAAIEETLEPFTAGADPDVVPEHHHHWLCGWVDGFSIRVFKRGRITRAFAAYHELAERLADYPVLDEQDYSAREYEDTISNLTDAAWKLKREYDLPENWESAAYDWFCENDCGAIESSDDRGGYPSEGQLRAAFDALGYQQAATV